MAEHAITKAEKIEHPQTYYRSPHELLGDADARGESARARHVGAGRPTDVDGEQRGYAGQRRGNAALGPFPARAGGTRETEARQKAAAQAGALNAWGRGCKRSTDARGVGSPKSRSPVA